MKALIFSLFLMYSCNITKTKTMECSKNEVQKITDDIMTKKGSLQYLNRIIDENFNADFYIIKYMPKDSLSLGGGAEIKVSKKGCTIIDQKFYQ